MPEGVQSASWTTRRDHGIVSDWVQVQIRRPMSQLKDKQIERKFSPLPPPLCSSQPSMEDEAPSYWKGHLFTQSTNSNANPIQKHLHRHTQNSIWPISWHPVSDWHIKFITAGIPDFLCKYRRPSTQPNAAWGFCTGVATELTFYKRAALLFRKAKTTPKDILVRQK